MQYDAEERETTVNTSDASDWVHIHTYQRKYITKLKANPAFEVVDESDGYLHVKIAADKWNPAQGAKRTRNMSPEARAAAGKRLAAVRAAKNG